jgi:hypothetical protein
MQKHARLRFLRAITLAIVVLLNFNSYAATTDTAITVPLGGNAWLSKNAGAKIDNKGLTGWVSSKDEVSVYIRVEQAGTLDIALRLKVPGGTSTISITVDKAQFKKQVANPDIAVINFGTIDVKSAGYIQIKLTGLNKTSAVYADVADVVLNGTALAKGAAYVKDNHGNYFYWGRRGPSVHLNFPLPDAAKTTAGWFYNEVTVPEGNDVQGSYFMANGFTGGYFGMQVNSPTERHVLFSIWSPFTTDDPKSIPDSLKIKLLKKGPGVHTGEFGSEGSGGQSYLNYPWVAGKTYAFLIHAQADATAKTTTFTAYFKEKNLDTWMLIASFKRPQSGFNLKGLYSFVENFDPETGNVHRMAYFGNQWVIDTSGKWYPITNALFTADATANINYRKDYSGGTEKSRFYLGNCGFFNDFTPMKTNLIRQQIDVAHPVIDFGKLP